jgi:hypothetical protein
MIAIRTIRGQRFDRHHRAIVDGDRFHVRCQRLDRNHGTIIRGNGSLSGGNRRLVHHDRRCFGSGGL